MRILSSEPRSVVELRRSLADRENIPKPYSIAVEALVFDRQGRWVLLERGPACRDEIGKLEGIGGCLERDADSFRTELKREIREEGGTGASIRICGFFEVRKDTVTTPGLGIRHWIIVSYICSLDSGELSIMEPSKNSGFRYLHLSEVEPARLSSSAAAAYRSLRAHSSALNTLLRANRA